MLTQAPIAIFQIANGWLVVMPEKPFNPYAGMKELIPGYDPTLDKEKEIDYNVARNVTMHETFESVLAFLAEKKIEK